MKLQQWKEAVVDCTEAIELGPKDEKPLERRAISYSHIEEFYDKAIEDYKKLLEIKPSHQPYIES
jgi:import receptor subunit TOM34